MSITKLFLFSKDTDATATEQGFHYQKLKTLKTWLENRVNGVDDIIYCDYEDDIFERNIKEGKSKFRQVKLYSINFSFTRVEIQKCLFNFFMLFVKGDYIDDEVSFLFETNSGIAKETRGNDADLLREWWHNQDSLNDDLASRCITRVKSIIDEFIIESSEKLRSVETNTELLKAREIYNNLSNETWSKFIHAIKWQFDEIVQKDAIPILLNDVVALVLQLPLPINFDRASDYISILHFEIAHRTASSEEEERILSNELLDYLLLNTGSEEDKWYAEVYAKWLSISKINHFYFGAFYEVISATRHCRWNLHNSNHSDLWLFLLNEYIKLPEIIIVCRRKAIYEYLFLLINPDPNTGLPNGTIEDQQEWIRSYFNESEHYNTLLDKEEDISLLTIVLAYNIHHQDFLRIDEINLWKSRIEQFIKKEISQCSNPDVLCQLYELLGHFYFHLTYPGPLQNKIELAIEAYGQILPLIHDTKIYSISRLSDQLNQILKMLIRHEIDVQITEAIEVFISEIEYHAFKTGRQHNLAHEWIDRGSIYLENPSTKNNLKALDCFHKAKELWYLYETQEGFILALINIAQIYNTLGMNLAAKYYGLCGVWASIHFGNQNNLKRISDSYSTVFHADFQQGAWISALDDYKQYISARIEFKAENLEIEEDESFRNTLFDLACILTAIPKIDTNLSAFIDYQKSAFGWLYTDHLQFWIDELTSRFQEPVIFKKVITDKLTGRPLNDIGATRTIEFITFGINWRITFQNTAIPNAIAEEFCSLLQITLCEIAMIGTDLHLVQMPTTIVISQAEQYNHFIKQRPSNEESIWDLGIPSLDTKEPDKIQFHYGYIATNVKILLNDLSLLPKEEFDDFFENLYDKQKLGGKGLSINTYQKVYLNLLSVEEFGRSRRSDFTAIPDNPINYQHTQLLSLFDEQSNKYNQEMSLRFIEQRNRNTFEKLSISLGNWFKEAEFITIIHELRKKDWLDWQILVALYNFVLDMKANNYMNSVQVTDAEERKAIFEAEFSRLGKIPESESYLPISTSQLNDPYFYFYIQKMPVETLKSFGLENKMKYPNFEAVRSLLNMKFRFNLDDVQENNPLRSI